LGRGLAEADRRLARALAEAAAGGRVVGLEARAAARADRAAARRSRGFTSSVIVVVKVPPWTRKGTTWTV